MARQIVTVFGGSGFLGRHLIQRLATNGYNVRAVVRDVEAAAHLKPMGDAGQVIPWPGNVCDPDSVKSALDGAAMAVNMVGILSEWGQQTFERVHVGGAANVARLASALGIKRLVHVSALGADASSESNYARTKALGEQAVLAAFPNATIMRPSVAFGPEDRFFNKFAAIGRISSVLPVIGVPIIPEIKFGGDDGISINLYGAGGTKFQPVYVGDVADAIMAALVDASAQGKTYELGGPATYTFKQVMETINTITAQTNWLLPVCFFAAEIMGTLLGLLPKPLLTTDQVKLLRHDNVVSGTLPGLAELGVQPSAVEAIAPTYLNRFRTPAQQHAVQD